MSLSPEQREHLRTLLENELRAAWHTAVAEGATPAAVAEVLDRRRRAVEASLFAEDLKGLGHDPVDDAGIGEKR